MKMKVRFIISIFAFALLALGCNKEDKIQEESFKLDQTTVILKDGEAGTTDIICSSQNVTPSAKSDADWLECTITARVLTLTYTRNETGAERTASIEVTAGKLKPVVVTVKQPNYVPETDDDLKVGDVTEDKLGVIYWVDPSNRQIAKAISIARETGKAWSDSEAEVGNLSLVNGSANAAILNSDHYPASYYCKNLGEGWYLPSRDEMLEIFDIYNGVPHDLCTVAQPGSITAEEKAARAAFDGLLTAADGVPMNEGGDTNNGYSYWTSSEFGANAAYWVRFGKFSLAHDVSNSSTSRYIRCMKVIGDYKYPAEPVVLNFSKSTLNFEGDASEETVSVTIKNGTLGEVTVDAEGASWCTASVTGNDIKISVTRNESGAARTTAVYVTGNSSNGLEPLTKEIAVSQAIYAANGFKVKEVYSEGGKAVGVVFWVSEDGMSAKIVALKRSEKVAWAIADSKCGADKNIVGCDDANDGSVNTAKLITYAGASASEDLPWLSYINSLGSGWYFPAHEELKALFAAYNGTTFGGATVSTYANLAEDSPEKLARIAFNKILTDLGGDPLDDLSQSNGDQYISSDESHEGTAGKDGQEVYSVRFGKVALNKDTAKSGTSRYVRGVKLVTK